MDTFTNKNSIFIYMILLIDIFTNDFIVNGVLSLNFTRPLALLIAILKLCDGFFILEEA